MTSVSLSAQPAARGAGLSARLVGLAGLAYVGMVAAQNVIRAALEPAADASVKDIVSYAVDDRGALELMFAFFVGELICLTVFAGAAHARVRRAPSGWLATAGLLGVAGIMVFFSLLVALDAALVVLGDSLAASPALTQALWALHATLFSLNFAAIGVAVLGLTVPSAEVGLVPAVFRPLGIIGFVLCAAGAIGVVPEAEGNMGLMAIALPGFLVWLAYMSAASLHLLRAETVAA